MITNNDNKSALNNQLKNSDTNNSNEKNNGIEDNSIKDNRKKENPPTKSQSVTGNKAAELQQLRDSFNADIDDWLIPNPLSAFSMSKDELRVALIQAQLALQATRESGFENVKPTGLLVLVNGMEEAGKGTAVTQLRQWVDPRLLKVEATIGAPPLKHQPIWQSFTKVLPRHGDVLVYFGNWYADLLNEVMRWAKQHPRAPKSSNLPSETVAQWQRYFEQQLGELNAFERDLSANDTKVLKCWFHVDKATLKKRFIPQDLAYLYQIDWLDDAVLDQFNEVAAALLRQQQDWVIIDGADKEDAAMQFCHHVLHAMQSALVSSVKKPTLTANDDLTLAPDAVTADDFKPAPIPKLLLNIPKKPELDKDDYHRKLSDKQDKLAKLLRSRHGRHVIFAFEGMDAAGKGGAIKRLVAPLDPREYQIYNIGAPMRFELEHPYLWRFWTRLPNEQTDRVSRIAIFDRTWYGRVLVERVEKLTAPKDWQRAYEEINRFENDLVNAEGIVLKFWLTIDKNEQLSRFEARSETVYKQYKLTEDDWRNRDKWGDYVQAGADMLARTDTKAAPWHIIATNDKRQARLQVLDAALTQLEKALDLP